MGEVQVDPPADVPPIGSVRPHGGRAGVQVTLRVGDRPLANVVLEPGQARDLPVELRVTGGGGTFEVVSAGERATVSPGVPGRLREGRVEVSAEVVPRFRLRRFALGGGDPTILVLILAVGLLVAQVAILDILLASGAAEGGGSGVSPEYLARLLRGEYDGAERGVVAIPGPRPKTGEPIEGFYLPPGHAGPITRMGGGANVGRQRRIGSPEVVEAGGGPSAGAGPAEKVQPPVVVNADAPSGDPEAAGEGEEESVAVEVNEGWGFSDWYDTEDAREDAREIKRELEVARQLLRLDPDDASGLQVRAYYEYLAMDMPAARRTYERFTQLYPEEPAGWNNLALTYKRTGDYAREEELYRVALALNPDDDAPINNLAVNLAHQGRYDEALALMKRLETLIPDDPYADLHRAKIYAAMGREERSYQYLQRSLAGMRKLDTLHDIEFRQDIRVDPVFEKMRHEKRFTDLLMRYYGDRPEGWWQRLVR